MKAPHSVDDGYETISYPYLARPINNPDSQLVCFIGEKTAIVVYGDGYTLSGDLIEGVLEHKFTKV